MIIFSKPNHKEIQRTKDFRQAAIWSIIQTSIGFRTYIYNIREWPLILVSQLCFMVQLIVHIPFIYYISKEQCLMMYDEWANRNLTSMVDRVRSDQGDPRYFLAELRSNDPIKVLQGESRNFIFLHRLPHMALNKKTVNCVNLTMYLSIVATAFLFHFTEVSYKVISCVCLSCDLLIIPGALYYLKYRQQWLFEDVDVPKFILQSRISKNRQTSSVPVNSSKPFDWSIFKFWQRNNRETLL